MPSPDTNSRQGFAIAPGDSVTAWALSPVSAIDYPGIAAPAEDRVNYHFINGFVDVGTLPCRIALMRELATRVPMLETDWPVETLHLPAASRRVEFTRFQYRPTRLARWCRTTLVPTTPGDHRFDLITCGGVHIWVDGVLQVAFEPYVRNSPQRREIALPLRAGGSDVVVLTEEMAERDTTWFFELGLISPAAITATLPGAQAEGDSAAIRQLAAGVRPLGERVGPEGLVLQFDAGVATPVEIAVTLRPGSQAGGEAMHYSLTLPQQQDSLFVCPAESLASGFYNIELVFAAQGARTTRAITCVVLPEEAPRLLASDIASRKCQALDHIVAEGEERMGTALALLAAGHADDPRLRRIIDKTLYVIEQRHDCSDFVAVPLLWALHRFADSLPADLLARARRALLDYRYWVDEPGNDVMWFWSENHVLCFHTAQLLAGLLLPDDIFTASGRTGREQAELGVARMGLWLDAIERDGLAEWNSAAYYPIDFIGLLALAELAPPAIATRAKAMLDRLFEMIALHTLAGVPAGSMGRAYGLELSAGAITELAPFAAVAFGQGWLNRGVAAFPQFLVGAYTPPAALAAYVSPPPGQAVTAHYVQGHAGAGRLALYKTAHVQLSACVDGRPGQTGHQQHLVDVRLATHPFARAWVNHPGEDDPWGHNRPSYWAGNGVMPRIGAHDNVALQLYDLGPAPRVGFTHAYLSVSGIDERLLAGNWLIARAGQGVVAIGATAPLEAVTTGAGAGREYRVAGSRTGWVTIVADCPDAAAFARFRVRIAQTNLTLDGRRLTLVRPDAPVLTLDWDHGLAVDGAAWAFPNPTVIPQVRTSDAKAW